MSRQRGTAGERGVKHGRELGSGTIGRGESRQRRLRERLELDVCDLADSRLPAVRRVLGGDADGDDVAVGLGERILQATSLGDLSFIARQGVEVRCGCGQLTPRFRKQRPLPAQTKPYPIISLYRDDQPPHPND